MKKIITITASLCLFIQVLAMAQESSPIPTITGTVTSLVDGQSISIDISSSDHRTFQLTRVLEVLGPDGNGADTAAITTGRTVTLHFIKDYDELVVDRILLGQ